MAERAPTLLLQDLAERYAVFFVDQFGVLLDGAKPYAGAIEALRYLKARGKTVIILSNSGRAGDYNGKRLAKSGIGPELYAHLVTSGDVAFELVRSGRPDLPAAAGTACLTISSGDDNNLADRLQFRTVHTAQAADIVVISGSQGDKIALEEYRAMLASAAKRGVPAICTNPDMEMLTGSGTAPGAGAVARLYEEMGGRVRWIGKPHIDIYDHAHHLCGALPKESIVAIGDSIEHDIAGAAGFGIDAALVRTGIHAGLLDESLDALLFESGPFRPMILPEFSVG